ncbi:hypothetical protein VKA52_13920 [Halobacillus sp. HZG1]|uniref:hypothetical protein n=1 Tax=Halobacillus sp. HZG1 TaxID=3111769 RepID=UPI002DBC6177|nr:hypothetical protein [Halobacillus sp. HZG1]MEC3884827.1 hypothetical protein [Halobacillus sp. HZG1]
MIKISTVFYDAAAEFNKDLPKVFELFSEKNKAEQLFSSLKKSKGAITCTFDPLGLERDNFLLENLLHEIFDHYKLQAPSIGRVLSKSLTKISLGTSGLLFQPIAPVLSVFSAALTMFELSKREKISQEDTAIKILQRFSATQDKLGSVETMVLACTSLLLTLGHYNKIIVHIRNPEHLNSLDIQLLRTYYSLFKDYPSRLQAASFLPKELLTKEGQARSKFVVVLDWQSINSSLELDTYQKSEQNTGNTNEWAEFRWFLYRYGLAFQPNSTIPPVVIGDDVFVGRETIMNEIANDISIVQQEKAFLSRKIKATAGMGKTKIASAILARTMAKKKSDIEYVYTGFSGEDSVAPTGLTEIRDTFTYLNLKLDQRLRVKLKSALLSEKSGIKKNFFQLFDHTSNLNSIVGGIMTMIGEQWSKPIELTKSGLFSLRDGFTGALSSSGRSIQFDQNIGKYVVDNKEGLEELLDQQVKQFLTLFEKNLEGRKSLLWIVDDSQWMDYASALFFRRLVKELGNKQFPVYLLMLERPDSIEKRKDLQELDKLITLNQEPHTLKGFQLPEISDLLYNAVSNDVNTTSFSSEVAEIIWKWFSEDASINSVEPLFIVEVVNLLGTYPHILYQVDQGTWKWKNDPITPKLIEEKLKEWRDNNQIAETFVGEKKFTASMLAVMNERVYRLARSYPNVPSLIAMLEVASIYGQPFQPNIIRKLVTPKLQLKDIPSKEMEYTYKLVVEKGMNVHENSWISYMFSHALYRDYFMIRYKHDKRGVSSDVHYQIFLEVEKALKETPNLPELFLDNLLLKTANHGSKSKKQKACKTAIKNYLYLAEKATQCYEFDKAKRYSLYAYETSKSYFSDLHPLSHKATNMTALSTAMLGDGEAALERLVNLIKSYKEKKLKGMKSAQKINKVELALSYMYKADLIIKFVNQLNEVSYIGNKYTKSEHMEHAFGDINSTIDLLSSLGKKGRWLSRLDEYRAYAYSCRARIHRFKMKRYEGELDKCTDDLNTAIYYMEKAAEKNPYLNNQLFVMYKSLAYSYEDMYESIIYKEYRSVNPENDEEYAFFREFTNKTILPKLNHALKIAEKMNENGIFKYSNVVLFDIRKRAYIYSLLQNWQCAREDIDTIFSKAMELEATNKLNKTGRAIIALTHLLVVKLELLEGTMEQERMKHHLLEAAKIADDLYRLNYLLGMNIEIQQTIEMLMNRFNIKVERGYYYDSLGDYFTNDYNELKPSHVRNFHPGI